MAAGFLGQGVRSSRQASSVRLCTPLGAPSTIAMLASPFP